MAQLEKAFARKSWSKIQKPARKRRGQNIDDAKNSHSASSPPDRRRTSRSSSGGPTRMRPIVDMPRPSHPRGRESSPSAGEGGGRVDECEVAERLREVAEKRAVGRVDLLAEQTDVV